MFNIEDVVKKIIIGDLNVREDQVTDTARFVEDLNADSLDMIEMVLDIESELKVEISDDKVINMKTVGDMIRYTSDAM